MGLSKFGILLLVKFLFYYWFSSYFTTGLVPILLLVKFLFYYWLSSYFTTGSVPILLLVKFLFLKKIGLGMCVREAGGRGMGRKRLFTKS